jgi:predicted Rossmann fold nucleotide-binding protein DprA/Smf involved in DNA uptake
MTNTIKQTACQKIISGGQTGVDRGVLDACLEKKSPCGGWCPKGRLAEDGRIDLKYPLKEAEKSSYDFRTRLNVMDSDGTLIIAQEKLSGGTLLTWQTATELKKPVLISSPINHKKRDAETTKIRHWIKANNISVLNVAGPRKSEWKEGYDFAFQLVSALIG